jgi:hypothetical protein
MAPKHHPTPLSGGERKALNKELGKARAMTNVLAAQSAEMRTKADIMLQQADQLLCESWNERTWRMANRSIRRQPSTRPSTAAFPGWRSGRRQDGPACVRPLSGRRRRPCLIPPPDGHSGFTGCFRPAIVQMNGLPPVTATVIPDV